MIKVIEKVKEPPLHEVALYTKNIEAKQEKLNYNFKSYLEHSFLSVSIQ
ncbi:MAG: hypothetical protein H6Q13_920 [Bacteroidetes bacterium]|nr:hypothetical protein [Bacteroidota bacterium]